MFLMVNPREGANPLGKSKRCEKKTRMYKFNKNNHKQ